MPMAQPGRSSDVDAIGGAFLRLDLPTLFRRRSTSASNFRPESDVELSRFTSVDGQALLNCPVIALPPVWCRRHVPTLGSRSSCETMVASPHSRAGH